MVLLKKVTSRSTCKVARIQKLLLGEDGLIRFVTVVLPNGNTLRRGIKDLVPLEAEISDHKL